MSLSIDAVQKALESGPYNEWLAPKVTELTNDSVTFEVEGRSEFTNSQAGEVIHGGVISSLLDLAACFALVGSLGGTAPTIDLNVSFLRPLVPGKVIVTGRLIKPGRSVAFAEASLWNEGQKVAATARGTFAASATNKIEGVVVDDGR